MQPFDLIQRMRPSVHEGLADTVLRHPRQTAFLVGAGVSMGSELPSFWEFEKNVLDTLMGDVLNDHEQQRVMARLRPEVLIQALWQTYGRDVFDVYRMLDCGRPNPNHYLLAEALRHGACVFTTNVDTLIEAACGDIGFDKLQVLFTPEDCRGLEKQPLDGCLVKVHGTIDRSRQGIERYVSIRMALDHVGRGVDLATGAVMKRAIRDRNLIVAGYSGNDHFSVQPLLVDEPSDQAIAWFLFSPTVDRPTIAEGKSQFRESRDKMYEAAYDGNILAMTRSVEESHMPSWEAISVLEILQNREHAMLIEGNSSKIAEAALSVVHLESPRRGRVASPPTSTSGPQPTMSLTATDAQRYEAAARVLVILAEVERTRAIIDKARNQPDSNLTNLANLAAACDTIERSGFKYEQLKAAEDEFQDLARGGKLLEAVERGLAVANGYRIVRRFETAIEVLEKTEEYLDDPRFKERIAGYDRNRLRSTLLLYRGLGYGLGGQQTLDQKIYALGCLTQALQAASLVGDVGKRAAVLNARGLILFQIAEQVEGTLQLAEDSLDEAFGLYARLQNPRTMFQPLRNQLMVHQLRSKTCDEADRRYWLERAKLRYGAAAAMLKRVEAGGPVGLDRAEIELRAGQLAIGLNEPDVARDHLESAYQIACDRQDPQRQVRILAERFQIPSDANDQTADEGLRLIQRRIQEHRDDLMQDVIQTRSLMRSAYRFAEASEDHRVMAIGILKRLETVMDDAGNRLVRDSIARHRAALEAAAS